ncbi:phage integrase family protein [Listeria aquatica]|uniref:Phage integrase family protein n=1 Tax=Listeria aquatica TaxID=1494960 RepID=A0A841ZNT7_9LIST|nr:tyrosine-type recombinase/integrase [Listeria aquatica]MBC1521142.1 phage integrase family protein [Listeria aquatica]
MPKLNDQSSACTVPTRNHHSFVTQATLAGANQADVQQFVGHKNLSMTDYYTHSTKQGTSQLVDIISEQLTDK